MKCFVFIVVVLNSLITTVSGISFGSLDDAPDSLEIVLKRTPADSSKALICNQFARNALRYYKHFDDYHQALQYAQRGLEFAKKANFAKGEAELYRTMGSVHFFLGDFDRAISFYSEALKVSEKLNDIESIATNNFNIGLSYQHQSKIFYSINYMQQALALWRQSGNVNRVLFAYESIIECFKNVGELKLSEKYALEALELALETGNRYFEAGLYDKLAEINNMQGNLPEMEKFYKLSINLYEELGDKKQVARVIFNNAENNSSENPELIMDLYNKSAAIFEKNQPEDISLFYIYQAIAELFKKENQPDSVRFYYEKAFSKALLSGMQTVIAEAYNVMGRYYLDINEIKNAERSYQKALDIAQKIDQINTLSAALSGLSEVSEQLGDYRAAFKYINQNQTFKDSLNNEANRKNILQLNIQYEFEKENNSIKMQLAQQELDIEQQKTIKRIVFAALIVAGILLGFIIRINFRNRRANVLLKEQHEEIVSINDELQQSHHELSHYKDHLEEMVNEQTEKLLQKETQLCTLSENLPGGYIYQKYSMLDGKEKMSYISNTAEKWIGLSVDNLMGDVQLIYRQIVPDDLERKRRLEKDSLSSMSSYSCEYRLIIDNQEIWLLENAMPRFDVHGNIVWDGIAIDITERKKFETKLIEAKEQAEESDRLKSAFLSNMSHEIRTPMNGIVGFLNFVEREDLPPVKRQTYIEIIRNSVQLLLQLIGDIVDISKIDSNKLSLHIVQFDINVLYDELDVFFQDFIMKKDKNLELLLDRSDFISPCLIKGDYSRIKQIFSNLIGNAVKFTEKGFIRFGYKVDKEQSELYCFVEDTGIGIPESKKEFIFERFRQAHDGQTQTLYGGTGLGLSITKNLVELMGGKIGVESTEGSGTTFYFTLPYYC